MTLLGKDVLHMISTISQCKKKIYWKSSMLKSFASQIRYPIKEMKICHRLKKIWASHVFNKETVCRIHAHDTENSDNLKMGKRFELAFNQRRYINV